MSLPPGNPAFAQAIVVSNGDVQSNGTPTTYDSIDVFDTDVFGNPSTYNADAALTLTGALNAYTYGVFNANADVTVAYASASFGGVINLNSGTLSASSISVDTFGAMHQAGGHYSVDDLYLDDGATLTYGVGDSITVDLGLQRGAVLTLAQDLSLAGAITLFNTASLDSAGHAISAYSLDISQGSSVTLDQNLTLTDGLSLTNGGSISRTAATISASYVDVFDSTIDLLSGDTFDPSAMSVFNHGAIVNAAAGVSLGSLTVVGSNVHGVHSTLNIDGDVGITGDAFASSGGVIKLNAGTLSAVSLSLSGAGSVEQAGGHYVTNSVHLDTNATLTYGTGDSIASDVGISSRASLTLGRDLSLAGAITVDGAASSLDSAGHAISANALGISHGAVLTFDRDLTLASGLSLSSEGSIARGTERISARYFSVDDAPFTLHADDSFDPAATNEVSNGGVVTTQPGVEIGSVNVHGTNGIGDRATFYVEGDVTIHGDANVSSGGVISLTAGTLSAHSLSFSGAGAAARVGGHYVTNALHLDSGATLSYLPGDSIVNDVSLSSGAVLTSFRDLSVAGDIAIDGVLTILDPAGNAISANSLAISNGATLALAQNLTLSSGLFLSSGGSISRSGQFISARSFSADDATLSVFAGDTYDPAAVSDVANGGVVNLFAGASLGPLVVHGTNGHGDRATLNINGDVTIHGELQVFSDGIIRWNEGILSAHTLGIRGAGAADRAGGQYAVHELFLYDGASLTYRAGDSVDTLVVEGGGSLLDELDPLSLTSLSLTGGGVLHLGAFTGTGPVSNWALRLAGDDRTLLETLIAGGSITGGSGPLVVTFDAGSNATFVSFTAVPEPSTYATALAGLACAGWHVLRRRRGR